MQVGEHNIKIDNKKTYIHVILKQVQDDKMQKTSRLV